MTQRQESNISKASTLFKRLSHHAARTGWWCLLFVCVAVEACVSGGASNHLPETSAPAHPYTIIKALAHDTTAFTQGLIYYDHKLIEGTGRQSWIATYNPRTEVYDRKVTLDKMYFGEGITTLQGKLYQLTWKNHVGFIYDLATFEKIGSFEYPFDGWGLTHDGHHLIASDGSDKLHYLDTVTLKEVFALSILDDGKPVYRINELEWVEPFILANHYITNEILVIDPVMARVITKIDLTPLQEMAKQIHPRINFLNGIAYDPEAKLFYVTGKLWPRMFVLEVDVAGFYGRVYDVF